MNDTIAALVTPFGRSGVGVIRLSGRAALAILRKLSGDERFEPAPRRAYLKKILDPQTAEPIDETLVTFFRAPHSFTGEDVVEIAAHGSPVVLRQIIDFCLAAGARLAEPGEFSLRALAHGRMNLSQAEAIRDLIDAQTTAAARQSLRQLRGELSNALQPFKDELLEVIVVLESALEFVEDDLPDFQTDRLAGRLRELSAGLDRMAATFQAGKLLREGLKIALVGRPNVGKSSLFNALLGQERAIVTDIAGTTRDHLHERLVIRDIPVSLIDTAGLRETVETVESIGVERSKRLMADADLVIVLFDGAARPEADDRRVLEETADLQRLVVFNKSDLGLHADFREIREGLRSPVIEISARTGYNLEPLQELILEPFQQNAASPEGFLIADARHHDLLVRAREEIDGSVVLLEQKTSEEIVLVGLHNALRYLGQITGETTTEDMLTRIFATFCIGK